jgi:hypothetical protein
MKNIKIKAIVFSSLIALSFTSCTTNIEPLDPSININSFSSVTGVYSMTAFNTSVPTDLDDDGTSSTNQMLETDCFNGNTLTISGNNTFTATSRGVDITVTGTTSSLGCYSEDDVTGTWTLVGNVLTLSYTDAGTPYTEIFIFSATNSTLTYTETQGEIVGTTSTNEPIFLTSNIDIIYKK